MVYICCLEGPAKSPIDMDPRDTDVQLLPS